MPFTPRVLNSNIFLQEARQIIRSGEGELIPTAKDVGDHTATIGYGYTFVRKGKGNSWNVFNKVVEDMLAIGIIWDKQKADEAQQLADRLSDENYAAAGESLDTGKVKGSGLAL